MSLTITDYLKKLINYLRLIFPLAFVSIKTRTSVKFQQKKRLNHRKLGNIFKNLMMFTHLADKLSQFLAKLQTSPL
jgi:hypothetical protein